MKTLSRNIFLDDYMLLYNDTPTEEDVHKEANL